MPIQDVDSQEYDPKTDVERSKIQKLQTLKDTDVVISNGIQSIAGVFRGDTSAIGHFAFLDNPIASPGLEEWLDREKRAMLGRGIMKDIADIMVPIEKGVIISSKDDQTVIEF